MQSFDYRFNVGGNFTAMMDEMAESTGRFNAAVEGTHSWLGKLGQTFAVWDLASNYVSKFNDTLSSVSSSGISLDRQMHDLSAIAGVTGDSLKQIEGYARSSAKAFGIDASQAVGSDTVPFIPTFTPLTTHFPYRRVLGASPGWVL